MSSTKINPVRFFVPSLVAWAEQTKRLMGEDEPHELPMNDVSFDVANRRTSPKLPFALLSGTAQKEFGSVEFQCRVTASFHSSAVPDPKKWPQEKWDELSDLEEARPGIFLNHLERNFKPGTGTSFLDCMTCPEPFQVHFMDSYAKEVDYDWEIIQIKEDGQEEMVVHRVAFTYGATVERVAD